MARYIDADLIEYESMCRAKGNGMYEDCEIAYKDQIDDIPTAQPEYYDYSDIDDVWEFYAEEQDINLTDGAKQLKDAMWVGYQKGKQDAHYQIRCAETVDVVEVVRCKDCKYWQDQEEGIVEVPICTRDTIMIIGENGYCSYGERAENE